MKASFEPGGQQHSFLLKVVFSDDDEVEHIWVADLETMDAGFRGVLTNEPLMTSLGFKQPWSLSPDGSPIGCSSTRAGWSVATPRGSFVSG